MYSRPTSAVGIHVIDQTAKNIWREW